MTAALPPDIEALLVPLGGSSGAGDNVRSDPGYRVIQQARHEDARLPQGVWKQEVKRADWRLVERTCTALLKTRGKDLQVIAWLAESWLQQRGFASLAASFLLLGEAARRFWPGIHPAIEDDGDSTARLSAFAWLNTRFPPIIRSLPIVAARAGPEGTFSWADYVNARSFELLRQRDPKSAERSEAAGAVTMAKFNAARAVTDSAFLLASNTDLARGRDALRDLNAVLDALCGAEAPTLGAINTAIEEVLGFYAIAVAERHVPASGPVPVSRPAATTVATAVQPAAPVSRQALQAQLLAIADTLAVLEPHGFAPYLIRRAVEWGDLPLTSLLALFARSGFDVGSVVDLLGLSVMTGADNPSADDNDA